MAILKNLPTEFQYSKYEKENPFSLYCSYLDYVRPIELQEKAQDGEEELREIKASY